MTEPTPRLLDLTPEQHPTLFPRKLGADGRVVNTSAVAKGRTLVRLAETVDGVVLHQTACVFGPLDPVRRYRRALKIPAHVTAFRDGVFVQAAPLPWFLYHANALNARSLGLECEGQYPGLRNDPSTPVREDEETFWAGGARTPTPLTPLAIATFRAALRHLVVGGRALGMPIRYLWAHRQSSDSRRSDPGQELWETVAVDYGQRELGLVLQPREVFGAGAKRGRPIPIAWQPEGGSGKY